MQQTGPNEGVAGTGVSPAMITIDGVGSLFAGEIEDFNLGLEAKLIENTGPTDPPGSTTFRTDDETGSWTGRGRIRGDKRPMPRYPAVATGNVKLIQKSITDRDGGTAAVNGVSFAAVFQKISFSHAPADDGGEDVWELSFTIVKSGPLTPIWDGLDPTAEAALQQLPTSGFKEMWLGRSKSIDPAGINSSAQSAYDFVSVGGSNTDETNMLVTITAGAVSPATGLKIRNKTISRTGSIGGRAILDWGIDGSDDQIVNGSQVSSRSDFEGYRQTVVTILDTSSSPEIVAEAYWPGFQGQVLAGGFVAWRLTARKINRFKALIVFEYINPGIAIASHAGGRQDYQVARVSGGNVQVLVQRVLQQGSGFQRLRMGRSYRRRVSREFTLSRIFAAGSAPDFQSIIETTNNATFLGLPAGSVLYLSSDLKSNLVLAGANYGFQMDYHFLWLSGGHYGIEGWDYELATTSAVSPGWINVSSLANSGLIADTPSQSDFSGFLA